ncbi:MAG: beta-ketoacyl-ACP synthase II [Spirochaetales bacterium]|uniref:3-oxoacyl-[acyl-carrier-protein] synthase 2 n=1 Tax=Candidatus Thalassospirochaeta sargassi TaxID=3119039 RepID=A0AAJ1MP75_9SPIO|nr:beta-ketoacyl-ACP synthase II [Spirochaetales bacterium]
MKRRVVITGLGTINSLGHNVDEFWAGIKSEKCGVGLITRTDPTELSTKVAAEVKDFKASDMMDKKDARKMALCTQFAVIAAGEAVKDAGLTEGNFNPERAGAIIGNGIGGFEITESSHKSLFEKGPQRTPPMTIPKLISNEIPGNVAITYGLKGPCWVVTTACASATDAIGNAMMTIQSGRADAIVAGGSEASITQLGVAGFNVIGALSTKYNDEPQKASRPFDKDRDGFVIGEGAACLVLEELEHAKARGAQIYAELAGYGNTCDAYHLTAPNPEGEGATRAIKLALEDAGMKPEDIDYVNAHGTSTPTNDPIETKSIKDALGDHAYKIKVSSTKGMTGHCIGGAGAVEAIICVKAIQDGFYPATINLDEPDPACDLDYVPNKGVEGEINVAMSNSLGFGGHNSIVIIKKFTE